MVTAASVRDADDLRVDAGFAAALRAPGFVMLATRGVRLAATGFGVRDLAGAAAFPAGFRPTAAFERGLLAAVVRAGALRVAALRVAVLRVAVLRVAATARFGVPAFAVRVDGRVVDFAAVARVRDVVAALRAGALRVAAATRPEDGFARVALLGARGVDALDVLFAGLAARVVAGLPASFLAAVERAAGLLAVRIVRAAVPRCVVPAVRRPPDFTAIARVRRPDGLLSSSLLMIWPFLICQCRYERGRSGCPSRDAGGAALSASCSKLDPFIRRSGVLPRIEIRGMTCKAIPSDY